MYLKKGRLYQWKFIPFELNNAPIEFQNMMDRILVRLFFVRHYIDDNLIFNKNRKKHKNHLTMVLEH